MLLSLTSLALAASPIPDTAFTRNPEGVGIGLILGAPTGVSLAWRPGGRFMVDGGVAWSFSATGKGWAQLHTDVCIDLADLRTADLPDMHFPIWIGAGPRARLGDGTGYDAFNLAIRVPVAMGFWHDDVPVEGFVELAPGIGIFPSTEFTMDAAVGVRFYMPAAEGSARFASPDVDAEVPY